MLRVTANDSLAVAFQLTTSNNEAVVAEVATGKFRDVPIAFVNFYLGLVTATDGRASTSARSPAGRTHPCLRSNPGSQNRADPVACSGANARAVSGCPGTQSPLSRSRTGCHPDRTAAVRRLQPGPWRLSFQKTLQDGVGTLIVRLPRSKLGPVPLPGPDLAG
jgi:hypothetical protein